MDFILPYLIRVVPDWTCSGPGNYGREADIRCEREDKIYFRKADVRLIVSN